MQAAYLDTSCLVAIAFGEPGSDRMRDELVRMDRVLSSTLLESEFLAAAEREGLRAEAHSLLAPIDWVHPGRRLTPEIERVLEAGYIRGADLHHLATALFVFADPGEASLFTLDARQRAVAAGLGFSVCPSGVIPGRSVGG